MKTLDRLPKRPLQFAGVQSMHGVSHAPSAVCRSSRWCSRRCDSGASGRMTMCTVGREPLARLEVGLARHVAGHQCTHQQGSPTATDGSQLGSAAMSTSRAARVRLRPRCQVPATDSRSRPLHTPPPSPAHTHRSAHLRRNAGHFDFNASARGHAGASLGGELADLCLPVSHRGELFRFDLGASAKRASTDADASRDKFTVAPSTEDCRSSKRSMPPCPC